MPDGSLRLIDAKIPASTPINIPQPSAFPSLSVLGAYSPRPTGVWGQGVDPVRKARDLEDPAEKQRLRVQQKLDWLKRQREATRQRHSVLSSLDEEPEAEAE